MGLLAALVASCAPPAGRPASPEPPRVVLPEPGRPYSADDMQATLRRAPDSVAVLVRRGVAEALANAVWTFDGRPYQVVSAKGSCGPVTCELSVQGAPTTPDMRTDHYIFRVDRVSSDVTSFSVNLGAYPVGLDPQLDAVARAGLPPERLEGLGYKSANWLPPPEFGRFELTYSEGGLEGSRGLRVVIDARIGSVITAEDFRW